MQDRCPEFLAIAEPQVKAELISYGIIFVLFDLAALPRVRKHGSTYESERGREIDDASHCR